MNLRSCSESFRRTLKQGWLRKKLISVVNEPVQVGEYRCKVGLSLGNSRFPQNTRDADSLLRLADDAM